MNTLPAALCLCLALLALSKAAPTQDGGVMGPDTAQDGERHLAIPDRCDGIEFDAIAPNEKGDTYFFKGDYVWKGFRGPAHLANESFKELDDFQHLGHVDAAFRSHNKDSNDHDHIYLFLDDQVFSYYDHVLEEGYPKGIQQDFPGVPSHLDAAVECPKGECVTDSVLFFHGSDVYNYDTDTKTVKKKMWSHLPNCTSAFRWLEHYYCFHGHNFTKFHPLTGEVVGQYPKDARNYFMSCPGFGHGGGYTPPKCSEVSLDAITTDDEGRIYAFRGPVYLRLDSHRDGIHAFPIARSWPELAGGVDAVFSYTDRIYMIKGDMVYIYKTAAHFTLIEGYPKTLKEELGVEGAVDAAFICPNEHVVHIVQGPKMLDIDLTTRATGRQARVPFAIDAGHCGSNGVQVFKGSKYYEYESPMTFGFSRILPMPHDITSAMMGCLD